MNGWKNLPNEIVSDIFEKLEKKDILQCSLTCRHWKSAAQHILFENLPYLTEEKMVALLLALSFYQGDHFKDSPGMFVRTVDCKGLSDNFEVESLDKQFPFIKNIIVPRATRTTLFSQPESDQYKYQITFINKFHGLVMNGKFSNLENIPYLDIDGYYLKLVFNRKDDITELELYDQSHFDTATNEIMQNLHSFSKLKVLRFTYSKGAIITLCLDSLLPKHHPTLNSITINFTYSSSLILNIRSLDMSSIQPLLNVKELSIRNHQLFYSGDKSFLYIMKKFPNLEKLYLYRGSYDMGKVFEINYNFTANTISRLSQFIKYTFSIKKSIISPIITDQFTPVVVDNCFKYLLQLQAIHNNVEIQLIILFETVRTDQQHIDTPDRKAYITVNHEDGEVKRVCKIEVTYKLPQDSTQEHYLELLQRIGKHKIDYLVLGDDYSLDYAHVCLNTIFDNCANIRTLYLDKREHLNVLEEETNSGEIVISNLEYITFECCAKTQELIFPFISTRCPKLKSLQLFNFSRFHPSVHPLSQEVVDYYSFFNMPTACLEKLHFRISSTEDVICQQYKELLFRLRTSTKKTRYCKIIFAEHTCEINFENDCTEADYNKCLEDEDSMVVDIYCKAVTEFIVESDTEKDGIIEKRSYIEKDL